MGRRIECDIEEATLEGDHGPVDGVVAICRECGHQSECPGISARSVRRALVLLKEDCPEESGGYYVATDGSHED